MDARDYTPIAIAIAQARPAKTPDPEEDAIRRHSSDFLKARDGVHTVRAMAPLPDQVTQPLRAVLTALRQSDDAQDLHATLARLAARLDAIEHAAQRLRDTIAEVDLEVARSVVIGSVK